MSGKLLILVALLTSAIFMYLCINDKKDELYAQLNPATAPIQPVSTTESETVQAIPEKVVMTTLPSFAYVSGNKDKIAAYLSNEDKEANITKSIEKLCTDDSCLKEVKYFDDIKPYTFTKETFELINYAKTEKLQAFSLTIDKETIKLEGELTKQEQIEQMQPFLDSFINQGYTLDNKMNIDNIQATKQEEIVKEEIVQETPKEALVTPEDVSIEEAAQNINEIVSANNITFDYRSSNISQESREALDKVLDILLGLDNVAIEVAGYTDSKGDAIYNKVLSQKRADSVRNYLIKSGIRAKLIKSVGYGEENPISDPKDIINRRVEIHLTEGE